MISRKQAVCAPLPGYQSRADSNWENGEKEGPLHGVRGALEDALRTLEVCFVLFLLFPQLSCARQETS